MDSAEIKEMVDEIRSRIDDLHARAKSIKQDAVAMALDVEQWGKRVSDSLPPSDQRDGLLAALANVTATLCTLGAVPERSVA